jgi:hypothetical protein
VIPHATACHTRRGGSLGTSTLGPALVWRNIEENFRSDGIFADHRRTRGEFTFGRIICGSQRVVASAHRSN